MAVTYTSRKTNMIGPSKKSVIMVIITGGTDVAVDTGLQNVEFCTIHSKDGSSSYNQSSIVRNSKEKVKEPPTTTRYGGWVYLGDVDSATYRLYAEGW